MAAAGETFYQMKVQFQKQFDSGGSDFEVVSDKEGDEEAEICRISESSSGNESGKSFQKLHKKFC